jgi:hypothetical protein
VKLRKDSANGKYVGPRDSAKIAHGSELYGFSAIPVPFFQIGVPCMRAVLRATLAARRAK